MEQNLDGKNAFQHLDDLMTYLLQQLPDATLLVAKIVGSGDPKTNAQIAAYNLAISTWETTVLKNGGPQHIQIVDMTSIQGDQLVDGIHPNDNAYKFMGSQWHDAIKAVVNKGWIKNPIGPDPKPLDGAGQGCHKKRDIEPRGQRGGHQCLGPVVWSSSGRLSHGVSHTLVPKLD